MGRADIKAKSVEVVDLIQKWSQSRNWVVTDKTQHPATIANPLSFQSNGLFYTALWQGQSSDHGISVSMRVRPRLTLTLILHLILFAGLWSAITLMRELFTDYTLISMAKLIFYAMVTLFALWWKDNKLSAKLTQIENSFWDCLKTSYDIRQLTRAQGELYTRQSRLSNELLLAGALVYMGLIFFGIWGAFAAGLLCAPFLTMIIAELLRNDDPNWHWRFWIMGNMARWTFLMLALLALIPILSSVEIFHALEIYQHETPPSMAQVFRQAHFRDVSPETASALEKDATARLNALATKDAGELKNKTDVEKIRLRKLFLTGHSLALFLVFMVAIYFFSLRPFLTLLNSQTIWNQELGKDHSGQGPFVPYFPGAWQWQTPGTLRLLILFHVVFDGVINLTAGLFCLEGISYLVAGRPLFIDPFGHLWSWLFTVSKILWGEVGGQFAGAILVLVITLPLGVLLISTIRRLMHTAFLLSQIFAMRGKKTNPLNPTYFALVDFVTKTCMKNGIKTPFVVLTSPRQTMVMRLQVLPLTNKAMIEISPDVLGLLDPNELNAAIAHELGHIKQGLKKTSFLKLLSSLALYPNYYLTLCLDWSKKEMEADAFALTVLPDPQPLKRALIKLSTAQMGYLNRSPLGSDRSSIKKETFGLRRFFDKLLRSRLCNKGQKIACSLRFFFGDGLFGYVHPYLSERLEAIEIKSPNPEDKKT